MTKPEFLNELQIALQGEMTPNQIDEHLRYYEKYIDDEVSLGKNEEVVVGELGNPRLIAKTLIGTSGNSQNNHTGQNIYDEYCESQEDERPTKGFRANYSSESGWDVRYGKLKINSWYGKLLFIIMAILLVIIVVNLVAFLLPIVISVGIIIYVLSYFLGKKR